MKIIYLHQYFNTPSMPGGTRSYEMARRMVDDGHEVHMVTSIREPESQCDGWFETLEAGIHVHWYPVPYSNHMNYLQRILAFIRFAIAAYKKSVSLEADVIFATSTPLTISLPGVLAARSKKIPMVFEVRDLWPEMPIAMGVLRNPFIQRAARKLEYWSYQNSAAVVALSPGMKAGIVSSGYPADNVAVIPNSSDNGDFIYCSDSARQFRLARQWLGDKPLLVYTGTFGKVNGVDYMVALARELKARGSDWCILLVGDGSEKAFVLKAAQKAGVYQNNLFIEEAVPKNEMPGLLSAATMASVLFIDLPEMRANSANKFFDALASGKPVLLNYGGWMHDLVTANDCGLPMWKKPVQEVAEILDTSLNNKDWLTEAGRSARNLAEKCFDRDLLADQLLAVLKAVVEGKENNVQEIAPGYYD